MVRNYLKKLCIIAAAALIFALGAFACHKLQPPVYAARATISVSGEAAESAPGMLTSEQFYQHIREISDFDGLITAAQIPGTCLIEITLQDDVHAHALAGLNAAIERLPAMMAYLSDNFRMETVLEAAVFQLPAEQPFKACILAALTGAAIAALLLFPLPPRNEELDLLDVLRSFQKLARRFWPGILAVCILTTGGNFARARLTYVPVYEAAALVSVGDYDPQAAQQISATFRGLLGSDVMADLMLSQLGAEEIGGSISAAQVAETNLFELTAAAADPEAAIQILQAAMACFPQAAIYANANLPLQVHQMPTASLANPFSAADAIIKGLFLGLALCACVGMTAALLIQPKGSGKFAKY